MPSQNRNNRRFSRATLVFLPLLALFFCATLIAAPEQDPESVIQSISDQLKGVLAQDRERLKDDQRYLYEVADRILGSHVDFSRVSSLALGRYWRRATPEQQARFSEAFKRMLVRTYAAAFVEFEDWSIRVLSPHPAVDETDILVRSQVVRPRGEPVSVNYRMYLNQVGEWMAYDVVIEGVSLVTNYRSSFAREIRRGGLEGLIRHVSSHSRPKIAES